MPYFNSCHRFINVPPQYPSNPWTGISPTPPGYTYQGQPINVNSGYDYRIGGYPMGVHPSWEPSVTTTPTYTVGPGQTVWINPNGTPWSGFGGGTFAPTGASGSWGPSVTPTPTFNPNTFAPENLWGLWPVAFPEPPGQSTHTPPSTSQPASVPSSCQATGTCPSQMPQYPPFNPFKPPSKPIFGGPEG